MLAALWSSRARPRAREAFSTVSQSPVSSDAGLTMLLGLECPSGLLRNQGKDGGARGPGPCLRPQLVPGRVRVFFAASRSSPGSGRGSFPHCRNSGAVVSPAGAPSRALAEPRTSRMPLAGAGPCGGAVSPGKEAPETEGILLALACRLPVLGPGAGFYPHFMALKIPLLFYFILLNKEEVIHER